MLYRRASLTFHKTSSMYGNTSFSYRGMRTMYCDASINARREHIKVMTGNPDKTYTLLDADGKSYQSATKGTLGGHRKDKIYGTLDCKGAARWIARGHYVKQRVFFADEQTAIQAGYRPCYECLREKYKVWKAGKDILNSVANGDK